MLTRQRQGEDRRRLALGVGTLAAGLLAFGPLVPFGPTPIVVQAATANLTVGTNSSAWTETAGAATFLHLVGEVKSLETQSSAGPVQVTCTLYDRSNAVMALESTPTAVAILRPQEVSPFDDVFPSAPAFDHYNCAAIGSVTPVVANHNFLAVVTSSSSDQQGNHVSGSVANENNVAIQNLRVIATFYDSNHTVVDEQGFMVDSLGPSPAQASFSGDRNAPAWDGVHWAALVEAPAPAVGLPESFDFGNVLTLTPSQRTISVANLGTADLHIPANAVSLSGPDAGDYRVSSDGCSTNTISAGSSCPINVTFTPAALGPTSALLQLVDDANGTPQSLLLTGTGVTRVALLPVLANQAFGGYTSVVYVTNTGARSASVGLQYLDTGGSPAGGGEATTLAPHATWVVRQDNGHAFAAGGAGSALVLSDQRVAAFVNEFAPGGVGDGTSYTAIGVGSAAATLYAPAIANGAYGGYTTGIGLFDAGDAPTDITITYRGLDGSTVKTQTIKGVAGHAYQAVYSGTSGQPSDAGLPAGFAGTATISSTSGPAQPLAAVVNEVGPGGQFSSYDAVAAGSTSLQAPVALNNAFGGFFTGIGIQNTTGTAGSVTVTYYDAGGTPTPKTFAIVANGYLPVYQGDLKQGPAPGAYTATIRSTVPVAAIVNETAPRAASGAQLSTAYNPSSGGAAAVSLPLVESNGADGWSTGLGIMNTGSSPTMVTVTYFDLGTGAPVGAVQSQSLQPNAFWGLYQPTGGLPNGLRASALVTTSGGTVAVICNESNATTFMSYDGQ